MGNSSTVVVARIGLGEGAFNTLSRFLAASAISQRTQSHKMTKAWVVAALALAAAGSAVAETLIFSDDFNTLVSAACVRFYVAVARSGARDRRLGPETHRHKCEGEWDILSWRG